MINRRKFIGSVTAGAAGIVMAQTGFANIIVPQKKDKLGVALVGLGYYSTDLLAPALQLTRHCRLAGIVSGTPSKIEDWKAKYKLADKNCYSYDTFDSIADNPDIDVVYVVLPPSMHAEYTIRAAKAGKHVFCEKPMAPSVSDCRNMIDACNKNKVKLAIGYRMHHEPNTRKVMEFVKKQTYGKPVKIMAEAGYVDPRTDHWKQKKALGGGVMGDMGVYPLNAARYTSGLEPIAVTARASTTRPEIYKEVEETMDFELEFPGGASAVCQASFGRNVNRLQADYTKGWIKLEPFSSYSGAVGLTSDGIKLNAPIENEQATQMDDDALAIMNNKPFLAPGEEGLKDIVVVEAIYRSVAAKGKVKI